MSILPIFAERTMSQPPIRKALKAAHNRLAGEHNNLVETVTKLQTLRNRLQAAIKS